MSNSPPPSAAVLATTTVQQDLGEDYHASLLVDSLQPNFYMLAAPRIAYQVFLCRECRDRQFMYHGSNVRPENVEESRQGFRNLTFKLCPRCIDTNIRIYKLYKDL
jgi:hypothetical protein